jgi:hypothetical protein
MSREPTEAAKAAKGIRTHLKAQGLSARVTSSNFSMGSSVDIHVTDLPPEIRKSVEDYCRDYQSGHFDGMTDSYEYSNRRKDIPQAKFVHVTNEMSDGMREAIFQHLRAYWAGGDKLRETYRDAQSIQFHGEWVSTQVHRQFSHEDSTFWEQQKPTRPAIAADHLQPKP